MSSPSSPGSIFGKRTFLLVLITIAAALFVSRLPLFDGKDNPFSHNGQSAGEASISTREMEPVKNLSIEVVGVTRPTRSGDIASAVYGKVEWLNPKFYEGGMFEKDEVLIKLSKGNYEALLAEKITELEQARLELASEQVEALKSVRKYDADGGRNGAESDLIMRLPGRRLATSRVEAGEAAVKAAREALERTTITAPYDCTISSTRVDLGSVVRGGDVVCSVFSSFEREVPLDIPVAYLRYIGEKVNGILTIQTLIKAPVLGNCSWHAVIQKMKGDVNPQTLTVTVIASILASNSHPPHLVYCPVKLPVIAEIRLTLPTPGFRIPRSAFLPGPCVHVVDAQGKLAKRKVELLGPLMDDYLVKKDNFEPGDILCLSVKGNVKEGDQVIAPAKQKDGEKKPS